MNDKERAVRKKQIQARKKAIKQKRIKKARRLLAVTIIIYLFLFLAILFGVSMSLKSCAKDEPKMNVSLVVGEEELDFDKSDIYFNGVMYLPITAVEALTDINVVGDKDTLSFIIEANSEFAKFYIGTEKVEINSNAIKLSASSLNIDGTLYIPFEFFQNHMKGIDIEVKKKAYIIKKKAGDELHFELKSPDTTLALDENNSINAEQFYEELGFELDLSSYEEYMNPTNRDEYLFLVNTSTPMGKDDKPTDLMGSIFTRPDRDTRMLRTYACMALEAFLKEAGANGYDDVTVTSAFRSYDEQSYLFNQEVALQGSEEEAAKYVTRPGTSEHQTGLAVDMHNMSYANKGFGNTDTARWLANNAHKFGFILRYPANKIDVTGIDYEPWHFRYVGRYHATKMYNLDMCLEEYMEYIEQ